MRLCRLPAEEPAVRRYVEELWLPYHRELAATVADHGLADDVDVAEEEVRFRLDRLASDGYRTWVAVDEPAGGRTGGEDALTDPESALAGFVSADEL